MACILVVDDDDNIRSSLEMILLYENYNVLKASQGREALKILKSGEDIDLLLLDIKMPGMDGIELLGKVKELYTNIPVIMISGNAEITMAVEATKRGAYDFLEKPLDQERILITISNALKQTKLSNQCRELERLIDKNRDILGESPAITEILGTIDQVAPTEARILITGENGTGKELIARAIHSNSKRKSKPFIEVNCAAIPENLIESELFGHEKGAFTHAHERRKGKFELAHEGSIFLDEIGDMSLAAQAKVLRVLEENKVTRVGGSQAININVRVIAATNKNLSEESSEKRFREDLFYRLNVVPIQSPPLRERFIDIPLLANHFLKHFTKRYGISTKVIEASALKILQEHSWPGNVRELKNLIERLVILSTSNKINTDDVKRHLSIPSSKEEGVFNYQTFEDFKKESEKLFLSRKLEETNWNVKKTAEILNMQRSNLYKKMEKYELTKPNIENS